MRSSVIVLVVLATAAHAEPSVGELRAQVKALKYVEAAKTVEQLLLTPLARGELIEVSMQEGLIKASLNDEAAAKAAFTRALWLDPEQRLPGRVAPRVSTPFLEAKSDVKRAGALVYAPDVQRRVGGDGWSLQAKAISDARGVVSEVLFTIVEDGVGRTHAARADAPVTLDGRGQRVTVSWALRSAAQWVLLEGSVTLPVAAAPVAAPLPALLPVETLPTLLPPEEIRRRLAAAAAPPPPPPRPAFSRVPGIVTLSLGAGLVGAGIIELIASETNAAYARTATRWSDVVGYTTYGRTEQVLGGIFLGVGSAAVAGGIALLIASFSSPLVTVSVVPSPGGASTVVSGVFP